MTFDLDNDCNSVASLKVLLYTEKVLTFYQNQILWEYLVQAYEGRIPLKLVLGE